MSAGGGSRCEHGTRCEPEEEVQDGGGHKVNANWILLARSEKSRSIESRCFIAGQQQELQAMSIYLNMPDGEI
jgi:hypothetical protein